MDITYLENMSNTTRNRRFWLFLSAGKSPQRNPDNEIARSTEVTVVSKLPRKMTIHKAIKEETVEKLKFAGPISTQA